MLQNAEGWGVIMKLTHTTFVAHDGTSAAAPLSLSVEALVSSSSAVAVLSAKKMKKDNVKFNTSTQRIVTAASDQTTADNSIRGVPGTWRLLFSYRQ